MDSDCFRWEVESAQARQCLRREMDLRHCGCHCWWSLFQLQLSTTTKVALNSTGTNTRALTTLHQGTLVVFKAMGSTSRVVHRLHVVLARDPPNYACLWAVVKMEKCFQTEALPQEFPNNLLVPLSLNAAHDVWYVLGRASRVHGGCLIAASTKP